MTLIVGLGNPGAKYKNNRHNVGFMVVDALIGDLIAEPIKKTSFQGELYKSGDILLLKPSTFMNLSGNSVLAVKNFYKIDLEHIIVIHDDLDLPLGVIRFKRGGGHGGHNGLKSIDAAIGKEYTRVRIGISKPQQKEDVVGYVLSDFGVAEKELLERIVNQAARASMALTKEPLESVSSRYSVKKPLSEARSHDL